MQRAVVVKHKVLITGGAGFIGSHLADQLLRAGHRVRVLDNLSPQVHGEGAARPGYLHRDVELMVGDVRSPDAVRRALADVDVVFHFAALVGVGQSMYRVADYTSVNVLGTSVLLEAIAKRPVQRLIVASSMSIYGEGRYLRRDGSVVDDARRSRDRVASGEWELVDEAGHPLRPVPTPEVKTPSLESVYALSKYDQERLCLVLGQAYGIPTTALRFFNVYGTRQALSNPYTGVLAIFASRLLNGKPPPLFEDGEQRRDFVSVHDVARACCLAMTSERAPGHAFNIGSGVPYTVKEIAHELSSVLGRRIAPEVTGQYRAGDIRHCFADVTRARELLGYEARVDFDEGLAELSTWLATQKPTDRVAQARRELTERGLSL